MRSIVFAVLALCGAASNTGCSGASWTWIDVPQALCQNGSPTGLGLSESDASDRLLIYLEGGGVCYNELTCADVAQADGYDGTEFFFAGASLSSRRLFTRDDVVNPFHDWDIAYVPYCSGDLFFGNNESPPIDGKTFVGFANMGHFLDVIVERFANPSQIVLTGSSAGGFGAEYNWDRAHDAFEGRPVHLLNDSGPTLSPTYDKECLQTQVRDAWNTDPIMPADCDDCRSPVGFSSILRHVAAKHPESRAGLISGTADEAIRKSLGTGYSDDCRTRADMPAADYEAGLLEIRATMADLPTFRSYLLGGDAAPLHTWLNRDPDEYEPPDGVALDSWIRAFIEGGEAFADVGP